MNQENINKLIIINKWYLYFKDCIYSDSLTSKEQQEFDEIYDIIKNYDY